VSGQLKDIVSQEALQDISLRVAQNWCSEILEVIVAYQAGANDETVEKIVLSGGGVFVEGFKECLLSELDADVTIMNPFDGLIVSEKKFPESLISKAAPQASIAIGLALRGVDDK
jgi:type IV pilus assembly protein PilM